MALSPGQRAPVVRLFARHREPYDLADVLGTQPVVLLFFPLAFSGTCTEEVCAVRDDWNAYERLEAAVFGISVDSPFVNVRFREEHGLPFPILSDFNRAAIEAYDVVRPELGGLERVAERTVFVIDRAGVIRYSWQGEHPGVVPPFEEVKAALRHVAE